MKNIVIIGPESTGKSTLCEQLAEHYKTCWCPEFAREYLKEIKSGYSYNDLLNIAHGQIELEDTLRMQAKNGFYFIVRLALLIRFGRKEFNVGCSFCQSARFISPLKLITLSDTSAFKPG